MHIQMRTRQRIDEESAIFNDGLRRPDGLPQSCYVIFEWWKARAEKYLHEYHPKPGVGWYK